MRTFTLLLTASSALAAGLYPRGQNDTITPTLPYTTGSEPTCTITDTTITTLTSCPQKTTCNGETLTFTSTEGPVPCAPSITCTCVLPTAEVTPIEGETSQLGPQPTATPSASPPVFTNQGDKAGAFTGAQGLAGMIFAAAAVLF